MTQTLASDRVRMPSLWLWLLRLGGGAVGLVLGFAVRPFARWAVDTLPVDLGPLELVAAVPQAWLVPILTAVGFAVGSWLAYEARNESLTVTVSDDGLLLEHHDVERFVPRSSIAALFTDPADLVILDANEREIFRADATDLPVEHLAAALRRHDHPWRGTRDPHEDAYRRWIDGDPDLDPHAHALLLERHRALASDRTAETEDLHAALQERGLVVRDRDGRQQVRRLASGTDGTAS